VLAAQVRGFCAGLCLLRTVTICCSLKRNFFKLRLLASRLAVQSSPLMIGVL
jgi:hypothetical protein